MELSYPVENHHFKLSNVGVLLNQVQKDSSNNADNIGTRFDMMTRTNSYASKAAHSNGCSVNELRVVNARPPGDISRYQSTPGVSSRQATSERVTPDRS